MKQIRNLLVVLLSSLCLVAGLIGLMACGPKDDGSEGIGEEYKAAYNVYKETVGDEALSLKDWYAEITADIEAVNGGTVSNITTVEYNKAQYVKITFESKKIYLEPLKGGDLKEYSLFSLSFKNEAGEALTSATRAYIDIFSVGTNGSNEVQATLNTNAYGKVDVYTEVASTPVSYYVRVNEQSAETYGIPLGYEPELKSVGGATNLDVTLYTPKTFEFSVHDYAVPPCDDYNGIEVSICYTDTAKVGVVVASGKLNEEGSLSLSFARHPGSTYEIRVNSETLPEGYEDVDPIALDFENNQIEIPLYLQKHYAEDVDIQFTEPDEKAPDVIVSDVEALEIGDALGEFVKDDEGDYYKYNDTPVYLPIKYLLDRIGDMTIAELNEDDEYFMYEKRTDENTNEWTRYSYHNMLVKYAEKVDNNGLYPINDDLYGFVQAAAEYGWFSSEDVDGELTILLPLVIYSQPKLVIGGPEISVKANEDVYFKEVPVPGYESVKTGFYKLEGTGSGGGAYVIDTFEIAENTPLIRYYKAMGGSNNYYIYVYLQEGQKFIHFSDAWTAVKITKVNPAEDPIWEDTITEEDLAHSHVLSGAIESPYEKEYEVFAYPSSYLAKDWNLYGAPTSGTKTYSNLIGLGYNFVIPYEDASVSFTVVDKGSVEGDVGYWRNVNISERAGQGFSYDSMDRYPTRSAMPTNTYNAWAQVSDKKACISFSHNGTEIVKIRIKVKVDLKKSLVYYDPGEGTGEVYESEGYSQNQKHIVLEPNASELGYTKEGYSFIGWQYTDPVSLTEKTILPGEVLNFTEHHNHFLVAQWRETEINSSQGKTLGVGDAAKAEDVDIDGAKYTATEITLASDIAAGAYKLTADLGTSKPSNFYADVDGVRSLFVRDDENSSDDKNVYVTYVNIGEGTTKIVFPSVDAEFKVTASLALEKIEIPVLENDIEKSAIVPVNGYFAEEEGVERTLFKAELGKDITGSVGGYEVKIKFASSEFTYGIKICTESASAVFAAEESSYFIVISEGDTHLWIMGSDMSYAQNVFASISLKRAYRITFNAGAEDVSVTKNNPILDKNPGDSFTFKTSDYFSGTYSGHTLWGWSYEGDDGQQMIYDGETFTMPNRNEVELTAVWKDTAIETIALAPQTTMQEDSTELVIDSTQYTSIKINLSNINYKNKAHALIVELGKSDYKGDLIFSVSGGLTFKMILMYSETLSTADNRVLVGWVFSTASYYTSFTLTLDDYSSSRGFDGVKINAKVKLVLSSALNKVDVGEEKKTDVTTVFDGGSSSSYSQYCWLLFADTILPGSKYLLHVKYIDTYFPASEINVKTGSSSTTPLQKVGDTNEWTAEITIATNLYLSLVPTDKDGQSRIGSAVAWLTQLSESEGEYLSESHPVSVTVSKSAAATVTLSTSVKANTPYIVWAEFAGAAPEDASITVINTLNKSNKFNYRQTKFTNASVSISTTSTDPITFTLHIKLYDPVDIYIETAEDTDNVCELPANKEQVDLYPSIEFGTSTGSKTRYKFTLSFPEQQSHDDVVINLVTRDNITFTFNKANNWTEGNLFLLNKAGEAYMWSETGAVKVKIAVEECLVATIGTATSSFELTSEHKEQDIWFYVTSSTSGTVLDGSRYITLTLTAGANEDNYATNGALTVKYGEETATFVKVPETNTYIASLVGVNDDKFTIKYSGQSNLQATIRAEYGGEIGILKTGEKVNEMPASSGRSKFFVKAEVDSTSNTYYLAITLHGGTESNSTEIDFSKLTLTLSEGNPAGGELVITGFTKSGEHDYVSGAFFKAKSSTSYITMTLAGVELNKAWTIKTKLCTGTQMKGGYGNIGILKGSMPDMYLSFENDESIKLNTEYALTIPGRDEKDGDELVYTVISGVEGSSVVLNRANNWTANVKLTSKLLHLSFSGCKSQTVGHATYIYLIDQTELAKEATITAIGAETSIDLLGYGIERTVNMPSGYDTSKLYEISYTGTTANVYIKDGSSSILCRAKAPGHAYLTGNKINISAEITSPCAIKLTIKECTEEPITLKSTGTYKVDIGKSYLMRLDESIDLSKQYDVSYTITIGKVGNIKVDFAFDKYFTNQTQLTNYYSSPTKKVTGSAKGVKFDSCVLTFGILYTTATTASQPGVTLSLTLTEVVG